jgi:flavin reductase (DIM6/NTAB) family NADH-FMN oxidoreductase RutF
MEPAAQQDSFRDLMAEFPTGVSIVAALDAHDQPLGMTCSSLTSVCLEPPTLLVCLASRSPTLAAANYQGRFSVNLLSAAAAGVARVFATRGVERYADVTWRPSPTGLPWLVDDTVALADCRVAGHTDVGDHTVLLGQVEYVAFGHGDPLLYGRRTFAGWRDGTPYPPASSGLPAADSRQPRLCYGAARVLRLPER